MKFRIEKKPNFNQWKKLLSENNEILNGNPQFLYDLQPNVDVWVLDDYKILIPLAIKTKFWIKKAFQPVGIQQTAFLSYHLPSDEEKKMIWNIWKKHYSFFDIQCPMSWCIDDYQMRKNFTLSLHLPYEQLKKKFSKGRKYEISHFSTELKIQKLSHFTVFDFWNNNRHYGDFKLVSQVKHLLAVFDKNSIAEFLGVEKDGKLLACIVLSHDNKRIYNVLSVFSEEGRIFNAQSYLIHYIIQKYAETNKVLDFEGSDLEGVAGFFKSWGSDLELYAKVSWQNGILKRKTLAK